MSEDHFQIVEGQARKVLEQICVISKMQKVLFTKFLVSQINNSIFRKVQRHVFNFGDLAFG